MRDIISIYPRYKSLPFQLTASSNFPPSPPSDKYTSRLSLIHSLSSLSFSLSAPSFPCASLSLCVFLSLLSFPYPPMCLPSSPYL